MGPKAAVPSMPPFQMVGIRQILAGSAYVLYFLLRGAKLPRKKEWYPILLLSVLSFMISNGLATLGVKLTTASFLKFMFFTLCCFSFCCCVRASHCVVFILLMRLKIIRRLSDFL